MKTSWIAAAAVGASLMSGLARADLNASVYDGWQFDGAGNISTAGLTLIGNFVDPNIDHWDGTQSYRWNPLGEDEAYTVTWSGYLLTPTDGQYEFRSVSDDGVQVFIDGLTVISNTPQQWYGEALGSATLTAGAHALDVRFYEAYTYDGIIFQWKVPGDADWSVVPASALVTAVPEPTSVALLVAGLAVAGAGRARRRAVGPSFSRS